MRRNGAGHFQVDVYSFFHIDGLGSVRFTCETDNHSKTVGKWSSKLPWMEGIGLGAFFFRFASICLGFFSIIGCLQKYGKVNKRNMW